MLLKNPSPFFANTKYILVAMVVFKYSLRYSVLVKKLYVLVLLRRLGVKWRLFSKFSFYLEFCKSRGILFLEIT